MKKLLLLLPVLLLSACSGEPNRCALEFSYNRIEKNNEALSSHIKPFVVMEKDEDVVLWIDEMAYYIYNVKLKDARGQEFYIQDCDTFHSHIIGDTLK